MSDSYSIQEVGGTELARHYPDRGLIAEAYVHKAILLAGTKASGWRRLFRKSERFIAVVSANAEGLRFFVALDNFAVFIPWSELSAEGVRDEPGTTVRVQTKALPDLELVFHLDDMAADAVFVKVMPALPTRYPPGRLPWPKPGAVAALLIVTVLAGFSLTFFPLAGWGQVAATLGVCVAITFLWQVCRPLWEETETR